MNYFYKATLLIIFLILIQFHKSAQKGSHPQLNAIDPYEFLHIVQNPDGTLTRLPQYWPYVPASTTDPSSPSLSRDVILNPSKNTWVRIYLPRFKLDMKEMSEEKLPIIVFAHGGGFIVASVGTPDVHEFCSNAASQLAALVISIEYRLAPEHRLPAAYEDTFEALGWIKEGKDEWVREYGNISRCVLMGASAGGNIAYHIGLKAAVQVDDLKPLIINGLVLIQPYFGGVNRTRSELRLANDSNFPLVVSDLMWNLSLPVGANRRHEYCDPFVGGGSSLLDRVRDLGWWVGIAACDGDPLFDRDVKLAGLFKRKEFNVRSVIDKGGYHGIFWTEPSKMKKVYDVTRDLLYQTAWSSG